MLDQYGAYADLNNLGVNLLSNLVWFLLGLISGVTLTFARRLLRPRFWSKMLRAKVVLVVGSHKGFEGYEASGMIGTADALALAEFVSYFKRNRFTNYEVVSSRSMGSETRPQNLILIGGPSGNEVSGEFLEKNAANQNVRFGNWREGFVGFELADKIYGATGEPVRMDAAAIVFHKSPYSEGRHVILVLGCFGYGTLAAAQLLCRTGSFTRKVWCRKQFEAAITCDVIEHAPFGTEVRCLV